MKLNLKTSLLVILGIIFLSAILTYFQLYLQKQKTAKLNEELVNAQKFTTYKNGLFQINYPYWPNTNPKLILGQGQIIIAVSNAGCNFVIAKGDPDVNSEMFSLKNHYVSAKQVYSVIFIAEKSVFESACRPFVEKTLSSVKLK